MTLKLTLHIYNRKWTKLDKAVQETWFLTKEQTKPNWIKLYKELGPHQGNAGHRRGNNSVVRT